MEINNLDEEVKTQLTKVTIKFPSRLLTSILETM